MIVAMEPRSPTLEVEKSKMTTSKHRARYLSIYIATFMYYNMAVSTMVFKLQLKENIKHAIICTITHIKCVGQKPKQMI